MGNISNYESRILLVDDEYDIALAFKISLEDYKSLRELFPTMRIDCYIKKPITTDDLVQRIKSELVADSPSS